MFTIQSCMDWFGDLVSFYFTDNFLEIIFIYFSNNFLLFGLESLGSNEELVFLFNISLT